MFTLKRLILMLSVILTVSVIILFLVLTVMDKEDHRKLVGYMVEGLTGYRVSVNGAMEIGLSVSPSFSATDIRLEPGDDGNIPTIRSIGRFGLSLATPSLSRGLFRIRELVAEDVQVNLQNGSPRQSGNGSQEDPVSIIENFKIPAIEKLRLRNITVIRDSHETEPALQAVLRNLNVDHEDDNRSMRIDGDGMVNRYDFKISGEIGPMSDLLTNGKPYSVKLFFQIADLVFQVAGEIADPLYGRGLDLRLSAEGTHIEELLRLLKPGFPILGRLSVQANITGDLSGPGLNGLEATVSNASDFVLSVNGGVADLFTGRGTSLTLNTECRNAEMLRFLLPDLVADRWQSVVAHTDIGKDASGFSLEKISIKASGNQGEILGATGRMKLNRRAAPAEVVHDLDVGFELSSPKTDGLKNIGISFFPELGMFTLKGRLEGDSHQLHFDTVTLETSAENGLKTRVSGNVDLFPLAGDRPLADIRLQAAVDAPTLEAAEIAAGKLILPSLGPVRGNAVITGDSEAVGVEDISLKIGSLETALMTLVGRIGRISFGKEDPFAEILIQGSLLSDEAAVFLSHAGFETPRLGPLSARWETTKHKEILSLDNVHIEVGTPGSFQIEADGRIPLHRAGGGKPEEPLELRCQLRAENFKLIGDILGTNFPELGTLNGDFMISGIAGDLKITDATLQTASPSGMNLLAQGGIRKISLDPKPELQGIDFWVSATAPNLSSIPMLSGKRLPELGSFTGETKVRGDGRLFRCEDLTVQTGVDNRSTFRLNGDMEIVPEKGSLSLQAVFESVTGPWVSEMFPESAEPGVPVNGRITMTRQDNRLRIEDAFIEIVGPKNNSFRFNGVVHADRPLPNLDAKFRMTCEDADQIAMIIGSDLPELASLEAVGNIRLGPRNFSADFEANLGQTAFTGNVMKDLENPPHTVDVEIDAKTVRLVDIGMETKPSERLETVPPPASTNPEKRWIFSSSLYDWDNLKTNAISLRTNIETVQGDDFILHDIIARLSLNRGLLSLEVPGVLYGNGRLSIKAEIDVAVSEPAMTLEMTGEKIEMENMPSHAISKLIPEGQLSVFLDLRSKGLSPRNIASSLNGELTMVIETGRIKSVADYITTDAFDIITGLPFISKYQELNCGAVRIDFENGIGKMSLAWDTDKVRTKGIGTINLVDETLDIVFSPKPKNRLLKYSSPLWIDGPLNRPVIKKIPFMEAARLSGDILLPYVFLSERAIGFLWKLLTDTKKDSSSCLLLVNPPK